LAGDVERGAAFGPGDSAWKAGRFGLGPPAQLGGRILEFLVSQELLDQLVTRVGKVLDAGRGVRIIGIGAGCGLAWNEHPALDLLERGGHHQKLPREVDVDATDDFDVLEILLGDAGDRDVLNIHLIAANEIQEEFERSGIIIQLDPVVVAIAGTGSGARGG